MTRCSLDTAKAHRLWPISLKLSMQIEREFTLQYCFSFLEFIKQGFPYCCLWIQLTCLNYCGFIYLDIEQFYKVKKKAISSTQKSSCIWQSNMILIKPSPCRNICSHLFIFQSLLLHLLSSLPLGLKLCIIFSSPWQSTCTGSFSLSIA